MCKNFETMLETMNSCAQETLIDAMCEQWMASDRADALKQIQANPGIDLAGIEGSVVSGLKKAAGLLKVDADELISEKCLEALANLSAPEIVLVLNAIHVQWIEDNFSAKRWAQKYFKHQLFQYRKTSRISFEEVEKDLLFVQRYLEAGKCSVNKAEIEEAFEVYVDTDKSESDLDVIAKRARTFAPEIIHFIQVYRDSLNPEKKAAEIAEINEFLAAHTNPEEIMEIMISAVTE